MHTKRKIESDEMEARLANAFQHVQPSSELVQTVRSRIGHLAPSVVIARRFDDSPRWFIALSGVISGALLLGN